MNGRGLIIGLAVAALLGVAAWVLFDHRTPPLTEAAPEIPCIPLEHVEPNVVTAIEEACHEVRQDPRSGPMWGRLGMVLAANGFREPAGECYEHASHFDSQNPLWPYLRALPLLKLDPRHAIALLMQALPLAVLEEERATILFRLGVAEVGEGQLDEGEKHLQALATLEPDSPRVHYGLGLLAVAREDRSAARRHLGMLVDNPFARRAACLLLVGLQDDSEAARNLQAQAVAVPADQDWPDPLENEMRRCRVELVTQIAQYQDFVRQGRQQEALDSLRRYVAQRPDASVFFVLGADLLSAGQLDEAERMLRETIRYDRKHVKARIMLASALLLKGENQRRDPDRKEASFESFRQAVVVADEALAMQRDIGFVHLTRGRALNHLGRTDAALAALRQAALMLPEDSDTHLCLGEALAEAGQLREALQHLENAVKVARPGDTRPQQTLEKWRRSSGP